MQYNIDEDMGIEYESSNEDYNRDVASKYTAQNQPICCHFDRLFACYSLILTSSKLKLKKIGCLTLM